MKLIALKDFSNEKVFDPATVVRRGHEYEGQVTRTVYSTERLMFVCWCDDQLWRAFDLQYFKPVSHAEQEDGT